MLRTYAALIAALFLASVSLGVAGIVQAQTVPTPVATVTLNWTNPSNWADTTSTPLAASLITQTRIEYGTCNGPGFGTKQGQWIQTGGSTHSTSPPLPAGTFCFQAFTSATGQANESAPSDITQVTITQAAPPPPPPKAPAPPKFTSYTVNPL